MRSLRCHRRHLVDRWIRIGHWRGAGRLIFGMVQQGIVYAGVDGQWFDFVLWRDAAERSACQPVRSDEGGGGKMTHETRPGAGSRAHSRFEAFRLCRRAA